MLEKKHCTSCQVLRNMDGGIWIVTRIKRWQCAECAARRNVSPYASNTTKKRLEIERQEKLA